MAAIKRLENELQGLEFLTCQIRFAFWQIKEKQRKVFSKNMSVGRVRDQQKQFEEELQREKQNQQDEEFTQLERHENSILRQENDKLRLRTCRIRDAMRTPICSNYGGPAMLGEISLEKQQLRVENVLSSG
ncbi:hypothetical protein GIB67_021326 [Kingdonia uniflora]|uniref:Uncharacterized protein n=1 Tax=Kingdonia uniflora TaxID=39325 RepID=A0A7J7LY80_9MAGN|nr:hypothetical protein GIB67_021326 [Kingdonia uniflora]